MTNQNRSSAVMQQRTEPHDSLDDFPTPPWAVRAFVSALEQRGLVGTDMTVREPAANRGFMVKGLAHFFDDVLASDVHDYGVGFPVEDFLFGPDQGKTDWVITNPPFRLAQQFVDRMLRVSRVGAAVIVRTSFLEGVGRYRELFAVTPPTLILQYAERVPMVKGRYDPEASTATTYAWLVWHHGSRGMPTEFDWIAPSKGLWWIDGDADPLETGSR